MGFEEPGFEGDSGKSMAGAIVAVLAVVVLGVLGLLVVGGVMVFTVRQSTVERVQAMEARDQAIVATVRAEEQVQAAQEALSATNDVTVQIDQAGSATLDGNQISTDDLIGRLQDISAAAGKRESQTNVTFQVEKTCPAKSLTPWLEACHEANIDRITIERK